MKIWFYIKTMDNKEFFTKICACCKKTCAICATGAIISVSGLEKHDLINDVNSAISSYQYTTITSTVGTTGGLSGETTETTVYLNPSIAEIQRHYPKMNFNNVRFVSD